jgi:hypothetical protein
MILGWISLPVIAPTDQPLTLAFMVCLRAYWLMIVVNMVHLFLPVWRALRSGEESPNIVFGSVGRVRVKCVRQNETPAGLRLARGWGFPRSWVEAAHAA